MIGYLIVAIGSFLLGATIMACCAMAGRADEEERKGDENELIDRRNFARQMRENAFRDERGNIIVSPELWEQIASIIESEPVKHGRWIYDRSYYEADECNCSICNQLITTAKGIRMNYCPNCGAKMDGKDAEK